MKKIFFILFVFLLITTCGGFKEAGKVLRNEKVNTTDEFLVKKREPLVLPPEYDKMPEPNTQVDGDSNDDENRIKKILKKTEKENSNDTSSSTEESILNKIKK